MTSQKQSYLHFYRNDVDGYIFHVVDDRFCDETRSFEVDSLSTIAPLLYGLLRMGTQRTFVVVTGKRESHIDFVFTRTRLNLNDGSVALAGDHGASLSAHHPKTQQNLNDDFDRYFYVIARDLNIIKHHKDNQKVSSIYSAAAEYIEANRNGLLAEGRLLVSLAGFKERLLDPGKRGES